MRKKTTPSNKMHCQEFAMRCCLIFNYFNWGQCQYLVVWEHFQGMYMEAYTRVFPNEKKLDSFSLETDTVSFERCFF